MPLNTSGSKAAFEQNVETEIKAGKPQKQAVAIAYAVKGTHQRDSQEVAAQKIRDAIARRKQRDAWEEGSHPRGESGEFGTSGTGPNGSLTKEEHLSAAKQHAEAAMHHSNERIKAVKNAENGTNNGPNLTAHYLAVKAHHNANQQHLFHSVFPLSKNAVAAKEASIKAHAETAKSKPEP